MAGLARLFADALGITGGIDDHLASPFQLRRTPWGVRVADDDHLLGLPEWTRVGQCVLLDGRQDATPGRRPVDIALLEQLVGLLTKAFFWPMGAGSVALLVWAGLRGGGARYGKAAAAVAAIAIAIGGWWYVRNLAVSGSFFGALDLKAAGDAGGTWQLIRSRWSLAELGAFARGLAVIAASFTWAGT
jgi:hypothetical protein